MNRREDTLAILHNLEKEAEQRYLPPMWFALIHASLGNRDACLDAIDEATRVRDWNRTWFKEPVLDVVRDDPRFQAAFRPLGMPAPVVRQQ